MKRGMIAAAAVASLAAVGFWAVLASDPVEPLPPSPAPQADPEPRAARPHVPPYPPPLPSPRQDRLAEALGGVAIRCHVGPGLEGETLFGGQVPRVEDGWFTTVVPELAGELWVGRVGQPASVQVRWEAEQVGQAVLCEATKVGRAELQVEVIDARGRPGVQVIVQGCGASGATDADGRVTLGVPVTGGCWLTAISLAPPYLGGELRVDGLEPDETRDVVFYVDPRSEDWTPRHATPGSELSAAQLDARATELRRIAAEGGEDAEVAEALADSHAKQAELQRATEEQEALLEEMDALTKAFREGDPEALRDLEDLSHDLIDNARRRLELMKPEPAD